MTDHINIEIKQLDFASTVVRRQESGQSYVPLFLARLWEVVHSLQEVNKGSHRRAKTQTVCTQVGLSGRESEVLALYY